MQTDRGLTERELDVMTLEQYWLELMPEIPFPEEKYLRGYLNRGTLARVMELIEDASRIQFSNYNRAGMWLMDQLSNEDARRRSKMDGRASDREVIRFDADGRKIA